MTQFIETLLDLDRADAVFALLFSFAHDSTYDREDAKGFDSALTDLFRGFKLSPAVREKLQRIYQSQIDSPRELAQSVEGVKRDFHDNREVLLSVLSLILRLVADEGLMSRRHCADLKQVLIGFRITQEEFESFSSEEQQLLSFALSGDGLSEWGVGSKELTMCYNLLGCSPVSTDSEIRRAYRKLAMQYHPDRLAALSLDEKSQGEYAQRFKKVKSAYDTINFSRAGKR